MEDIKGRAREFGGMLNQPREEITISFSKSREKTKTIT